MTAKEMFEILGFKQVKFKINENMMDTEIKYEISYNNNYVKMEVLFQYGGFFTNWLVKKIKSDEYEEIGSGYVDDCILLAIMQQMKELGWLDNAIRAYNKVLIDILDTVEQEPKVGRWIPVEEGLPEENEYVDITVLYKDEDTEYQCDTDVARYYCQMWIDGHGVPIIGDVIAWKPRPEPYRKEDK